MMPVPLRRPVNELDFGIGGGGGEGMIFGVAVSSAMGLHQFSISVRISAWIISCTSFAEYEASLTVMQLLRSLSYSVKHETNPSMFYLQFFLRHLMQYLVKSPVELTLS